MARSHIHSVAMTVTFAVICITHSLVSALPSPKVRRKISMINRYEDQLGIVVPNTFEMNPLLNSSSFKPDATIPLLDFSGRRFRFGTIEGKRVVIVMSGLGMLNAGLATQLLLSFFNVKGVIHYGIAGNADPSLNVGDIAIPRMWSHTGLWYWQKHGDGEGDQLALEANGDYTRTLGSLSFAEYTVNSSKAASNILNRIWYQPEEVFSVRGTPEVREHYFWVPVDPKYYEIAKSLKAWTPERCINSTTCLSAPPKVVMVDRGCSASVFVDNAAYRTFIFDKFKVSPVEMESAGVALVCLASRVPFIVIRALSDLAGGSSHSNEADVFGGLASHNSANAAIQFIKLLK